MPTEGENRKKKVSVRSGGSLLAHDIWDLAYCSQNLTEVISPSLTGQATESRWLKNHSRYLNKPILHQRGSCALSWSRLLISLFPMKRPVTVFTLQCFKNLDKYVCSSQTRFPISDWSRQHWQNQSTASQCSKPSPNNEMSTEFPHPHPQFTGLLTGLPCTHTMALW